MSLVCSVQSLALVAIFLPGPAGAAPASVRQSDDPVVARVNGVALHASDAPGGLVSAAVDAQLLLAACKKAHRWPSAVAVKKALDRFGLKLDQIDAFELNEAFAAQSLAVIRAGGYDPAKVNAWGGAIAIGHPLGASGARILTTLLNRLETDGGKYGIATMCIGGGQGIASIIEKL